jgi:hypothetical protein
MTSQSSGSADPELFSCRLRRRGARALAQRAEVNCKPASVWRREHSSRKTRGIFPVILRPHDAKRARNVAISPWN